MAPDRGSLTVLMTADAVGGVWTYALELAGALAPHGARVVLATMGDRPSPAQRDAAHALANVELVESDYRLEWADDPWDDLARAGDWLLDLESRVAPDVVHLNGYTHASLDWTSPVCVVAHSCVLSWWRAVKHEAPPPRWSRYRAAVRAGVRAANVVVAPTRAMLGALCLEYGAPRRSRVISNGVDPARFIAPGPARKEGMILTAGRAWDEAKNVGALAAIARRLRWPVYVAGDADPASTATSDVRWLGRLPRADVAGWMTRAAIYALPARYEPFGISALEAALSGCALVLGDIASLREVWGDAALFAPPDDHQALEDALGLLARDAGMRARLATAARQRARHYTAARMAHAYAALYRELRGHGAARTPRETATCAS